MLTVGLLLSALGLLAMPGLLRPLARRLPPAEWAALGALLLAAGAVVLEVLTTLVALPTVMPPSRTSSNRPLIIWRTSSGAANRFRMTLAMGSRASPSCASV